MIAVGQKDRISFHKPYCGELALIRNISVLDGIYIAVFPDLKIIDIAAVRY